ncbi:ferredoxin [Clostridium lundense]|uniref:ferredoxin n=1 Tax=Clostridium lundense TaxID=319475 RepID=UPI0004827449|nr:ferredoxin [Clostridium lundense]
MRAFINKEACIGCGLCPSVAPDVFEMDDDGKARTIVEDVPSSSEDAAKEAESSCPTNAIATE